MHFVLVQPPIGKKTVSLSPPLGIAYLAAALEENGIRVSCIASDAENFDVDQTISKINDLQPTIVGFSVATLAVNNTLDIAGQLKKKYPEILTIAGGPHPTVLPDEFLINGVDFVVRGEGEQTILDLVAYAKGKKPIDEIHGVLYRSQNDIHCNNPRKLIKDLDTLPIPAWHLLPIDRFQSDFKKTDLSLPILTSRGCPGKCTFCYKGLFGNSFRVRSPEHVVNEIKYLKRRFNIQEFSILDDSFSSIPKRVIEICELLIKNRVNLPWSLPSGIRVDTVSQDLFTALKRSGCYRIGFGVETGDEYIMKCIRKNVTLEQVRKAVRMAKNTGFHVSCFFMIGNLCETEETVDKTIAFAKELDPDIAQFTIATPYPGSDMYQILDKENRIISHNWDDYDSFDSRKPVFSHQNLDEMIIAKKLKEAYRSFYFRPKYIFKRLKSIANIMEIAKFFSAFRRLLKILIAGEK